MQFGTSTRIVIEDQRASAVEPQLKPLIIGAAQKAVANLQHVIADGEFDGADFKVRFETDQKGDTPPVYLSIRGKAAGQKDDTLLYETSKVTVARSAYDDQIDTYNIMNAAIGESVTTPFGSGLEDVVALARDNVAISNKVMLTLIYQYYEGSPISITYADGVSTVRGVPAEVRAAMAGKNVYAMYYNATIGLMEYVELTENSDGTWTFISADTVSSYVALYEDKFQLTADGVAHGALYIDYAYADANIENTMYYVEDLDGIKDIFGNDAMYLSPGGAGYNAHKYFLASGGIEGFYVYAAAAGGAYLTDIEVGTALADTIKYKDVYEVIPITYEDGMPTILAAHLDAMDEPDLRRERRGYVGLYAARDGEYTDAEFEYLCQIGKDAERGYMIGLNSRYGGRNGYVSAMMALNAYTNNPKLTLCETKYGVIDGTYVCAGTLMAIYVAYRRTFQPGYVMAKTTLPLISSVSFAGLLGDIEQLDKLQNYGIMSIYQATVGSPVTLYYPCTAATDYVQNKEEYLITATDMFAREVRGSLDPHIARGEDNKTSPGFVGYKAVRYLNKMRNFMAPVKYKYVKQYGVFEDVELISITNNPDYEGGIMISIRLIYKYAVNHIEVIIYI